MKTILLLLPFVVIFFISVKAEGTISQDTSRTINEELRNNFSSSNNASSTFNFFGVDVKNTVTAKIGVVIGLAIFIFAAGFMFGAGFLTTPKLKDTFTSLLWFGSGNKK